MYTFRTGIYFAKTRTDNHMHQNKIKKSPENWGTIVENQSLVLRAFEFYRNGKIAFVDAYIAALSESSEAEIISFDADYDKIKAVRQFKMPE